MDENHYIKLDERGKLIVVNKHTLEVVRRETDTDLDTSELVRFDTAEGAVYYPKNIIPEKIHVNYYRYNQVLGDYICDRIMDGESLTKICKRSGFPSYSVVQRWQVDYPEFRDKLQAARTARAEYFHDLIIEEAEEVNEDNSKSTKVKIDAYRWAAEKGNPDRYGNKMQIVSEKVVSLVVNTGFSQVDDDIKKEAIEAEAREVESDEDSAL